MNTPTRPESLYERLGVRPFINARGCITTLGGSIMPPQVIEAMVEAAQRFIPLNDLIERAGARIADLTGAEAAYVSAGAASGMLLAGAACLTGTDQEAVQALPDVGGRPNEFVISMVDLHYYVHQGFRVAGGKLVKVGTKEAVTAEDYDLGIGERTAAAVFFLGKQPVEQLPHVIEIAHGRGVPVIVDAAAQLPPRSNLTGLTGMGADLAVYSGGKGLRGPQSTGLILGRADLVRACALNSNPNSAIGRGMKVGKEEIAGIVTAVELFMERDEEAVLREWEDRCRVIADAVQNVQGVRAEVLPPFTNMEGGAHPPASPLAVVHITRDAGLTVPQVQAALEEGDPSIVVEVSEISITFGPMTLQEGEAEIIAARLREVLG